MADSQSFDDFMGAPPAATGDKPPMSFDQMWPPTAPPGPEPATTEDMPYGRSQMINMANMFMSGQQKTKNDVEAHRKNYLADANGETDDRSVTYDKGDGKLTPIDPDKHVALIDPKDGKVKVFNRSAETDEKTPIISPLKALGSWFSTGFATGAPGQLSSATKGGEIAAAGVRQGIAVPRAIASPSTAINSQGVTLAKTPWVGKALRESADTMGGQIENKVGQTAESLSSTGEVLGPAEAGAKTRAGFKLWQDAEFGESGNVAQKYDAVDRFVDPAKKITLNNTWDVVKELQKKYGAANLEESAALKQVLPTLRKPGGLDYDTMKFVRTRIGKMIQNPGELSGGINEAELKQIYGGMTDDMGKLVQKAGGDKATAAWQEANNYTKSVNDKRRALDSAFGNTTGKDEGLFGQVIKYAGSKDSANIQALSHAKEVLPPSHWQDLGASVIDKLGRANPTAANPTSAFDLATFAKNFGGLSEEGKGALFGAPGTSHRQALEDLAKLASEGPNVSKMGSATAGHGLGIPGSVAAVEALHEVPTLLHEGIGVGHGVKAASILTGLIGSKLYANYLSKPATAWGISRWMNAYKNVHEQPGQNALAAFNNASKGVGQMIDKDVKSGDPSAISDYLSRAADDVRNSNVQ